MIQPARLVRFKREAGLIFVSLPAKEESCSCPFFSEPQRSRALVSHFLREICLPGCVRV